MADNKKLQAFHADMAELMKKHPDVKLDVQLQAEIVAIDITKKSKGGIELTDVPKT